MVWVKGYTLFLQSRCEYACDDRSKPQVIVVTRPQFPDSGRLIRNARKGWLGYRIVMHCAMRMLPSFGH